MELIADGIIQQIRHMLARIFWAGGLPSTVPTHFIYNLWHEGLLCDFLQKKITDYVLLYWLLIATYLFNERVVFDSVIYAGQDIYVGLSEYFAPIWVARYTFFFISSAGLYALILLSGVLF